MDEDGIVTTYLYDDADRLLSKVKDGIPTNYTWDNDGNLLTKGTQTYTWNAAGKLASWSDGSDIVTYTYNGDGARQTYTVNSLTTNYLQDLSVGIPVTLQETTSGVTIDYVYGIDLLSDVNTGNSSYYLADGLGSTRMLTDETGTVVGSYSFDAFGSVREYTGATTTDYNFAGEKMDADSGLQYLRARYYDPEDGRFISIDPIPHSVIDTQKSHSYVYVENNPIGKVDPLGTSSTRSPIKQL